jgi:hypothetical protein
MSKKPHTPITSATHRLSLEIAKPHAAVWKAFTGDIHSWWPKDFYATESPQRIVFEVKPGGRLYEDSGKGNGLVWYHVIALDAPNSITMSGFIAPPFGGPATSLLNVSFSARVNPPRPWKSPILHLVVWETPAPQPRAGVCFLRTASNPGSNEGRKSEVRVKTSRLCGHRRQLIRRGAGCACANGGGHGAAAQRWRDPWW